MSRRQLTQGVIVGGVIVWGVIVRRAIGIGGNYPGGIVRGATDQGEIVLFPVSTCSFVSTKLALNYIKQARCS